MKFKFFSLMLLTASIALQANDLPTNSIDNIDKLVQEVQKNLEAIKNGERDLEGYFSETVQQPTNETVSVQPEIVQEVPVELIVSESNSLQETIKDVATNTIEEKPAIIPSSVEAWGKRVADFGSLTAKQFAAFKQMVIQKGGSFVELAQNNPQYVAAGVAAIIIFGGVTYYLYNNGYLYRAQYRIRSAVRTASEYRKTFATVALLAAAGAAGFAAYKMGYITPEMLASVKKAVTDRMPNMPEIKFQERLDAAKTVMGQASKYVGDNASALKISATEKLGAAQEYVFACGSTAKDATANKLSVVKGWANSGAVYAKDAYAKFSESTFSKVMFGALPKKNN